MALVYDQASVFIAEVFPLSQAERKSNPILPLSPDTAGSIKHILEAVRTHLGMDLAYVSEISGGRAIFREVEGPGAEDLLSVGSSMSMDDTYCQYILAGRLPQVIPDTAAEPLAQTLTATRGFPIGAHLSVPLKLPDGTIYGMFCCLSREPDPTLNARDLSTLSAFADVAAVEVGRDVERERQRLEAKARISQLFEPGAHDVVYQPIVRLSDDRATGFECLSRFAAPPVRSPDKWFADAKTANLDIELQVVAVLKGLAALDRFPLDISLSINASPAAILRGDLIGVLEKLSLPRVILEVTEQEAIVDYHALNIALAPLRSGGMRLAIDDAGSGYAGLRHILDLSPDFIKLDITITRDIDRDAARRALAAALITFGHQTGSKIVAEGVETAAELATLKQLGVEKAQGYLLGRPAPLADALALAGNVLEIKGIKHAA